MKILTFKVVDDDLCGAEDVELYPDSSVIYNRKPLFLPDWSEGFVAQVALAVRIGRLGKHVAHRFAHRYWDAATVCLVTNAAGEECRDALARGFDGAIALGDWLVPEDRARITLQARLGEELWPLPQPPLEDLVNRAIVAASARMTIKMGDVFCLKLGEPRPIAIGDIVYGRMNDQEILTIKIK